MGKLGGGVTVCLVGNWEPSIGDAYHEVCTFCPVATLNWRVENDEN